MLTKLPQSIEAQAIDLEQTVIGAILHNNSLIDSWGLTEDDFGEPLHREIYRTMQMNHVAGRGNSATTLGVTFMHDVPVTADCTVPEYIRRLQTAGFGFTAGIEQELREHARRRKLSALGESLQWQAGDRDSDMRVAAADALSMLDDILSATKAKNTEKPMESIVRAAVDDLLAGKSTQFIPTGLKGMDDVIGGWHRGQFCILAGRPSMGKSMIALSALVRTANAGHGTMLFSLEMGHHEIACRVMSDLAYTRDRPIPYSWGLSGKLTDDQLERWQVAVAQKMAMPLVIDEQRGLTVAEIMARARKQKKKFEDEGRSLDLLVVDHLGLIKPSSRYAGNKVQETGEISDGLATIAKELDCCVLALQQLNRGTESRENKRPGLADLRNSGDLEQDAHVVMFAYRESYYLERVKFDPGTQQEMDRMARLEALKNTAEILIAKNRNGPTETVHVFCEPSCNAIRDLARRQQNEPR